MKKFYSILTGTFLSLLALTVIPSCGDDDDDSPNNNQDNTETPDENQENNSDGDNNSDSDSDNSNTNQGNSTALDFAYGADPSWVTEMEDNNVKFYDKDGKETEIFSLLSNIGFNATRLRVWVNPLATNGYSTEMKRDKAYCDITDVIVKAKRAQAQGQKIMIDFHYADNWCDPSQQPKPEAWDNIASMDELAQAVYDYTLDCMQQLANEGIDITWVQIANESGTGFMTTQSDKSTSSDSQIALTNGSLKNNNGENYAKLHNSARKAVKEVYENALIVVHFANGNNLSKLTWGLNYLKSGGTDFDIFGVSLYPNFSDNEWYKNYIDQTINNLNSIAADYDKDVMICEIGTPAISSWNGKRAITNAVIRAKEEVKRCKGVFYWEPECYGWNGYSMGGFLSNGSPADALEVFAGKMTSSDLLPETDPNQVDKGDVLTIAYISGEEIGELEKQDDGTYQGTFTLVGSGSNWPNFTITDQDGKKYGTSDWNSQYSCVEAHKSGTDNFDHFWIESGTWTITFDLENQKWSAVSASK